MQDNRKIIALGVAGALVLALVGAQVKRRAAPTTAAAPSAAPSLSAATSAGPSASVSAAPAKPAWQVMKFGFDCAGFAPEVSEPCGELPAPARKLLEVSDWYRVSALPCSQVFDAARLASVAAALRAVAALRVEQLSPFARAELQSATLKLLSCATGAEPAESAKGVQGQARSLLRRLGLSKEQRERLPTSAESLSGWFGDASTLQRGAGKTMLHTQGDGFAYAYTQAQGKDFVVNIARLVLLDEHGQPTPTDIVYRVLARRLHGEGAQVCIAEADATCRTPGRLRPLPSELGERLVQGAPGGGSIGCNKCHVANMLHGQPYGPDLGLALPEATASSVREQLAPLFAQ